MEHLLNILSPKNNEEKEDLIENDAESKQNLKTDLKINNEETLKPENVEEINTQPIVEEVDSYKAEQIAIDLIEKEEEKALQIDETAKVVVAEPQKEEVISIVN